MSEQPLKPWRWSLEHLPDGGFTARRRSWLNFHFLAAAASAMGSALFLLGYTLGRDESSFTQSGVGLLVFTSISYGIYRLNAGKSVSVHGTRLVVTSAANQVKRFEAENLRGLNIEWARETGDNGETRWELHAQLKDGRTELLVSGLEDQREAPWLQWMAERALGLQDGPPA